MISPPSPERTRKHTLTHADNIPVVRWALCAHSTPVVHRVGTQHLMIQSRDRETRKRQTER